MKGENIVLSDNFTIKGSVKEQVMLNLVTGERYELQSGQWNLICLFNGKNSLDDILEQYNEESKLTVIDFIERLKSIGAVFSTKDKIYKNLNTNLVPNIRLRAIHLEASSNCNMKCAHCYQGDLYSASENLSFKEIENLIGEMKELQVEGVSVSGGEPFLDSKTFDIVDCLEKSDIRVLSFFTNGLLVNKDVINKILSFRSKPTVFVSLDSITSEGMKFRGFDDKLGREAIKTTLVNIENLVSNKIRVVINTVMNKYNIKDIPEMYETVQKLNINSWRIGFPKKTGFFKKNNKLALKWDMIAESSFSLLKHHIENKRPFHLQMEYLYREELLENFEKLTDNDYVCDYEGKRESCCIKPNGDVVACAYCTDFPVGNIRKNSLKDIWYSSYMKKFKEIKIKDVYECRDCNLRQYCATGCRINAFFINGNYYNAKDDYACKAVAFFVDKVMPYLKEQGIMK